MGCLKLTYYDEGVRLRPVVLNSPVRYIDPDGREPGDAGGYNVVSCNGVLYLKTPEGTSHRIPDEYASILKDGDVLAGNILEMDVLPKQEGEEGACLYVVIEYLSKLLGGSVTRDDVLATANSLYGDKYDANIHGSSILLAQPFLKIREIQSGVLYYAAMPSIYNYKVSGTGIAHSMAVVGWNIDDSSVIRWDPEDGSYDRVNIRWRESLLYGIEAM